MTAEHQYQLAAAQARAAIGAINSGIGNLNSALASLTAAQRVQAQTAVQLAENAVDALDVTAPIAGTVQLGGSSQAAPGGSGGNLDSVLSQLPADAQQQAASALGGSATSGGGGAGVQTTGPLTVGTPVTTGTTLATIVDVSARCPCRRTWTRPTCSWSSPGSGRRPSWTPYRAGSTRRPSPRSSCPRPSPPAAG